MLRVRPGATPARTLRRAACISVTVTDLPSYCAPSQVRRSKRKYAPVPQRKLLCGLQPRGSSLTRVPRARCLVRFWSGCGPVVDPVRGFLAPMAEAGLVRRRRGRSDWLVGRAISVGAGRKVNDATQFCRRSNWRRHPRNDLHCPFHVRPSGALVVRARHLAQATRFGNSRQPRSRKARCHVERRATDYRFRLEPGCGSSRAHRWRCPDIPSWAAAG